MAGRRIAAASTGGTTSASNGVATRPKPMNPLLDSPRQATAAPAASQNSGSELMETASPSMSPAAFPPAASRSAVRIGVGLCRLAGFPSATAQLHRVLAGRLVLGQIGGNDRGSIVVPVFSGPIRKFIDDLELVENSALI